MIDPAEYPVTMIEQLAEELGIPIWERSYFFRGFSEFLYDHGVYHTRNFWSKETEPVLLEFGKKPDLTKLGFGPNGTCVDENCFSKEEWLDWIS